MAPLPKKKHSKKRQGDKSAHFAIGRPALSRCPQCQRARMSHRVCAHCGYYNGREVVVSDSDLV